jgi:hypothetical protein
MGWCTWIEVTLAPGAIDIVGGYLLGGSLHGCHIPTSLLDFLQFAVVLDDLEEILMLFSPLGWFFILIGLLLRGTLLSSLDSFSLFLLRLSLAASLQMSVDTVSIEFSAADLATHSIGGFVTIVTFEELVALRLRICSIHNNKLRMIILVLLWTMTQADPKCAYTETTAGELCP